MASAILLKLCALALLASATGCESWSEQRADAKRLRESKQASRARQRDAAVCTDIEGGRGECSLSAECGCPPGQKCDVDDSGATYCVESGTGRLLTHCSDTSECASGLTCTNHICRGNCFSATDTTSCGLGKCVVIKEQEAATDQRRFVCRGGFSGSCSDVVLRPNAEPDKQPHVIVALCGPPPRENFAVHRRVELDLDEYLINNNGKLEVIPRGDGNFSDSCVDVHLSRGKLLASCLTESGVPVLAELSLDEHIGYHFDLDRQTLWIE